MSMHQQQLAFTLFEMVVAVAIFAVMGAIAYPGLSEMAKTGQIVSESNQRISDLQFAVSYLNRDWLQVSRRKIRNRYGDEESNVMIEENTITFTRAGRSNLLQQNRSSLQRVRYSLLEKKLIRQHWLSLDQGIAEEPFTTVLLNDIEAFEINFIDGSEKKIENWPAIESVGTGKPIALSFVLELEGLGQIQRILEIPDGVIQ